MKDAKVILPLSVAHRWSHSKGQLKHRLVLDCSPLAGKLSYGRIKLPDLNFLRHQLQQGDFIGLIDISIIKIGLSLSFMSILASFYLHFTLDPTFADYLW